MKPILLGKTMTRFLPYILIILVLIIASFYYFFMGPSDLQKPALMDNDSVKNAPQAGSDFPDIPADGIVNYKVSTLAVTFSAEYVYKAGNTDNEETSGIITLEHVKRLLLNKIGEFFKDKTEAGISGLSKEQIASFAAGLLEIKVIRRAQDGRSFYIKAEAGGDPAGILKYINDIRNNDIKGMDLLETRKIAENALNEIDILRRESSSDHETVQEQERLAKAVTELKMINAFERGRVSQQISQNDAAINAYSSAIDINPQFAYAYFKRGIAYCSYNFEMPNAISLCKDRDKSLEDISKAIDLAPHNAYFYYRRGYGCKANNVVQAIADFNKAIELDPENDRAFYERGDVYLGLSEYSSAIKDFHKAIELNPRSMMAYNNLGLAYYKLSTYRKAINSFNKAIELSPQNARLYYNRGTAYEELGEYQQAFDDFGRAIELEPQFREADLHRSGVYKKLTGKPWDALTQSVVTANKPTTMKTEDTPEQSGSSHDSAGEPLKGHDSDSAVSGVHSAPMHEEKSDWELSSLLPGQWRGKAIVFDKSARKNVAFDIRNTLYSDGRFESVTRVSDGKVLNFSGKWRVSNGNMVWETLSSNQPSTRVPNTEANKIIEINSHIVVLQEKGFQSKWVKE